jgi:hypothetical protein
MSSLRRALPFAGVILGGMLGCIASGNAQTKVERTGEEEGGDRRSNALISRTREMAIVPTYSTIATMADTIVIGIRVQSGREDVKPIDPERKPPVREYRSTFCVTCVLKGNSDLLGEELTVVHSSCHPSADRRTRDRCLSFPSRHVKYEVSSDGHVPRIDILSGLTHLLFLRQTHGGLYTPAAPPEFARKSAAVLLENSGAGQQSALSRLRIPARPETKGQSRSTDDAGSDVGTEKRRVPRQRATTGQDAAK